MEDVKHVYVVIDYSTDTQCAKIAGIYGTRSKANQRRDELLNEPVPVEFLRRNYSVAKVRLDLPVDWFI